MGDMELRLPIACALAALALAGCATSRPDTTAMGAGPSCDLRVDIGADHRCAMTHVTPANDEWQLTNGMRTFEAQIQPRNNSVPASEFRFPPH